MAFVLGWAVSAYLLTAQLAVIVADASGSTIGGVISGLAGAGILGGVGVQMLRNQSKAERYHDAQIKRHVAEIVRQGAELEREREANEKCRSRCEALEAHCAQLEGQLARREPE